MFTDEARSAVGALASFLADRPAADTEFVSLGQNCSTAWYLKQAGLKRASYPFDWLFTSPQIVADCLDHGFARFLDPALVRPKAGDANAAGHALYHASLFNHRNPLRSEEDQAYYRRACERFDVLLASRRAVVFVVTLVNEPDKRRGWAAGFGGAFPMPLRQDLDTLQPLFDAVRRRHADARFVVVDPYTNQPRRGVSCRGAGPDTLLLRFDAGGDSTGVYFTDALDDQACRAVFAGLVGTAAAADRPAQVAAVGSA